MPSPCREAGRGRWKNFGPKIYLYLSKQAYIHKSSLYEMETIFYLLYNIRENAIPPLTKKFWTLNLSLCTRLVSQIPKKSYFKVKIIFYLFYKIRRNATPTSIQGGGDREEWKDLNQNSIFIYIKQACIQKIKSVDQFWDENYILPLILYKGNAPPPYRAMGEDENILNQHLCLYIKTGLYPKNQVCRPIFRWKLYLLSYYKRGNASHPSGEGEEEGDENFWT